MPGTRKLGRKSDCRTAMLRGMVTFLFENGKIETTMYRAKEVQAVAEKYITLAKDSSLHSKRQAMAFITKEDVVNKLYNEIAPKYADRNGGYCRIIKTGPRRGDAAEMALVSLVEDEIKAKEAPKTDAPAAETKPVDMVKGASKEAEN